jgi:hypothetical protein
VKGPLSSYKTIEKLVPKNSNLSFSEIHVYKKGESNPVKVFKAYEDAGGKYEPTKAEQRSLNFDKALDSLEKLVFSIGVFFEGYETRTFTVHDDKIIFTAEHNRIQKPFNSPVYYPVSKMDFIAGLKDIHIGEWKKRYDDVTVMDGIQWELKIYFTDGHEPVEISGSNAYPYNFKELENMLGMHEEDLVDIIQ